MIQRRMGRCTQKLLQAVSRYGGLGSSCRLFRSGEERELGLWY